MAAKTGRRKQESGFLIRPASSRDKKTVLTFTQHTFGEYGDYIAEIWDDWLADPEGPFWVADAAGRAVGIGKLTFHSQEEAWMEGLRVDPSYRGKGVARALHQKCVEEAAARGVRVVRFATNSENKPVHRLAEEFGFHKISSFAYYIAEPQKGEAREPFILGPGLFSVVHDSILEQEFSRAGQGLYSWHWVWKELTEERLKEHLHRGELVAYIGHGGVVDALAVVDWPEKGESLCVGYLDGKPAAVQELALALRQHEVEGHFPTSWSLLTVLEEVGYELGFEPEMWIFEKRFDQDG